MGIHQFVDNFSMSIAGKATKNCKYFSKSIESKTIAEYIDIVEIDMPQLNGEGYYTLNVKCEDKTEEAAFRIEQWKGDDYPTIIYHHGAAEGSYDFSFNKLLGNNKKNISANLIVIQAIFNHSNKEFMESIAYLDNYAIMLASSTVLVEKLIKQIREVNTSKIVISGTSLGGFVTNLHFTHYNTADLYKPLLAGTRLADAFVESAYSSVASEKGKANADTLRKVLNFNNDFAKRKQDGLYCLLGEYDQIVRYDTHSVDFNSENLKAIPYGHATGATKYKILRQHIFDGINA